MSEGRIEAEDGKLDFEVSSEDTEVELLLHQTGADVRDVPEASGTQREDWSHMGPLYGARQKWNWTGQPSGVLEAEATGGKVDHDIEERGVPAPSLPLLWQNMQEGKGSRHRGGKLRDMGAFGFLGLGCLRGSHRSPPRFSRNLGMKMLVQIVGTYHGP